MQESKPRTFIISRTDAIGDVVLTLPLAGMLKERFPNCRALFIGRAYTKEVILASIHVDEFLDRDQVIANPELLSNTGAEAIIHVFPDKQIAKAAWKARIPKRIGTMSRLPHWLYCNRLVSLSRKNSNLHEAQLNSILLKPLGFKVPLALNEISRYYGFSRIAALPAALPVYFDKKKFNLVIHPKSKGSAREWPLAHYANLCKLLPSEKFNILITGTPAEGELIHAGMPEIFSLPNVHDLSGKMNLRELISLIAAADGLLACSTGPLHIAAAAGKKALGLYPPMRPIHPGRWAPLGPGASVLVRDAECSNCRDSGACTCLASISPQQVEAEILKWL
ncbi:MAG: glycosyltransferase family 9 protein [Bacteroidota bacterium]